MSNLPTVVKLQDADAGASAQVLVSGGFNCFAWHVPLAEAPANLLWSQSDFAQGQQRPSSAGIPIMFPFAGRIGAAAYEYAGQTYRLEPGDSLGNALHGFVLNRPWRLKTQTPESVTAEFQASVDDPSILDRWPGDFGIRGTYRVRGAELQSEFLLWNPGSTPLPFGFGTHPYFTLPLVVGGNGELTQVDVPVTAEWWLANMLPTGALEETDRSRLLATGGQLAGTAFDEPFQLRPSATGYVTSLRDPSSRTLSMRFGSECIAAVVYTPGHREAICIEPQTCVPDYFRLAEAGKPAGLRVLAPGESLTVRVVMAYGEQPMS